MLSEIIPVFKQAYPEVTVEISELGLPALTKLLLEDQLDLGIASSVSTAPFEDNARILRKEEVFFAVSRAHPYVQEHPGTCLLYTSRCV